ncbi:MAG TPA: YfhO family protein, partial [Thermoanaerobaculia bacterium]|nr:YfhO family protein [Thermoanaerobaculia bacterium]
TRDIVLSGDFPSWNPYLSQGQPLAANPEFAVFYPPHWLLLLPNFELAFRLHILLHYYLAAIGVYVLLRSWRLRMESAMFGAFAYTFGGLLLSLSCLLPYLFCLAWLPWLLFFLERNKALAAICLALIFLGGDPVTIAQCMLIAGVFVVERRASARSVLVLVAALLIASVQIIPAADHLRDSVRSHPFSFALVSSWSTPPLRAAEVFVADALGPASHHAAFFWGTALYNWVDPFYLSIYPGLLVAALALAAIALRRRGWIFVLAALAVGFLLAFGSHTPILKLLYDARLFSSFRYPEKFLILAIVPLTIFAAFAFDSIDARLARIAAAIAVATGAVCALLAIASLAPSYVPAFARFWHIEVHPLRNQMAALSFASWAGGVARALAIAALLLVRTRMSAETWSRLAIVVLLIDLGIERPRVAETVPHEFFSQRPQSIPPLRNDVRLFHQPDWYGAAPIARAYFDRPEMYWVIRNGAFPLFNATWGIATALNRDIDRTSLLPSAAFIDAMHTLRTRMPRWYEPLMLMTNAGYRAMYVPLQQGGSGESVRPIVFVPAQTNPRYYFADSVAPAREFVPRLAAGKWTRRIAFVDGVAAVADGQVVRVAERSNAAQLSVRSTGDALLVISITRHKYWHATIDGRAAPLLPVNIAFQGLRVPPGTHNVRLWYDNPLVRWFGVVSLISLLCLCTNSVVTSVRRRTRTGSPSSASSGR